jgi:cell division transport system permease protein
MRASFVFSEVLTGLRRNITMTIAMMVTTAVSLGMLGGGLLAVRTIDKMQANFLDDVEVSVYLTEDVSARDTTCSQEPCQSLRQALENTDNVESVVFENRQEAFERYQRIFADSPELLEAGRPEALPAALHVTLVDPQRSSEIVQKFEGQAGVRNVDDQKEFLEEFFNVLNLIRNAMFVLALVLASAAFLLISNTVQLSAFNRRTEVGIMRLVGATRWYTQLPFLLEALVTGLIGWILAVAGLFGLNALFLDDILAATNSVIPRVHALDIAVISPWLLLASLLISGITGYVTLRLYVRN